MLRRILILSLAAAAISCSRTPPLFSEQNAHAHVEQLAGTIGSRPTGTAANQRARAYIVDQLTLFGFNVRVQEADARRPELGRTAHVSNIIALLPGARREAIGLVAHYDSRPEAPGAADDGLGVAVMLEAARVFAGRTDRQWSLAVLLTDGEEYGLMGAAALVTDRDVMDRLAAYVQVEAVGSDGPALLFQTGPGNGWLVSPWARRAPHPRGGSYATEVYKRLPNDTDFTILAREDVPGLNFAPAGDSYAYHTDRDTPERLSAATIRDTGENVAAILDALNGQDITRRTAASATFFDIGGTTGMAFGPSSGGLLAVAALALGILAWVRVTAASIRLAGLARWLLTFVWSAAGLVVVGAAMVATTWALRDVRESYHPWYAHPDRLFVLLVSVGAVTGWGVTRLGYWLPARAHGLRHPVVAWSVTLPVWIALASAALFVAPASAYVWTIPLLTAGILLSLVPPGQAVLIRAASLVIFGVTATLWLTNAILLLRFSVATFGRLPLITPVFVFPAILLAAGTMLVPPLVGAFAAARRLVRPSILTTVALLVVAISAGAAYRAPAYTAEAPLRRTVRVLQTGAEPTSVWEVGSVEPGLDLSTGAPAGWSRVNDAPPGGLPWGKLPQPFVFRTAAPSIGAAPAGITQATLQRVAGGLELSIAVVPRAQGLTVSFVLPPGVTPARHNLPGLVRLGSWTATFIAPPPEGILFKASFGTGESCRRRTPARLRHLAQAAWRRRMAVAPGMAAARADSLDRHGGMVPSRGPRRRRAITLKCVTTTAINVIDSDQSLRLRRGRAGGGLRGPRGGARPPWPRPRGGPEGLPHLAAPLRQVFARASGARIGRAGRRADGRRDGQQLQLVRGLSRRVRPRACRHRDPAGPRHLVAAGKCWPAAVLKSGSSRTLAAKAACRSPSPPCGPSATSRGSPTTCSRCPDASPTHADGAWPLRSTSSRRSAPSTGGASSMRSARRYRCSARSATCSRAPSRR